MQSMLVFWVLTCRLAAFAMAPVRLPTAAEVAAKKRQRERTTLNVPSINTAASSAVNTQSTRAPAAASFGSNVPNNNSSAAARTPAVAPTQAGATSAARTCSIPQLPACGTSLNNCPQPLPPAAATASVSPAAPVNPNALIVSSRQRGNPVLKAIRNVQWQFGETSADYLVPDTACALFLSLRYHLLHPNYLICRLREMQHHNLLRMVLLLVDSDDAERPVLDVTRMAVAKDSTLVLAWSVQEVARYLETFRAYAKKPADLIKERSDGAFLSSLGEVLTTARFVNKSDVATLHSTFGSPRAIMHASAEELSLCPGLGERKVKRLRECFLEPFVSRNAKTVAAADAQGNANAGDTAPNDGGE